MRAKNKLSVLSDDQLQEFHLASLEVLERTGVQIQEPESLELLRGAGAWVEKDRVRIPSFLVEEALRTAPRRVILCNRDGDREMRLEDRRSFFGAVFDMPDFIDPYTGERRPFVAADYRPLSLAIDFCPNVDFAKFSAHASDFPAEVRDQVAFKNIVRYTKKPIGVNAITDLDLADVLDMAAAVAGGYDNLRQRPFIFHPAEPVTPLVHGNESLRKVLLCAERGIPLVYYGMPAAGSTAPATLAGVLLLGNVEVLSGLVIHQLKAKGAPFIYGFIPSLMDMRTSVWSYGAPELSLMCAAEADITQYYGLPMYGTAGCTDSQELDAQAAAQGAISCLMATLSGANLVHDLALMGGATVASVEMVVLMNEILGMIRHVVEGVEISAETLCLDLIDKVGPGGTYIAEDHTYERFRQFWYPEVFSRIRYQVSDGEMVSLGEKLSQRAREIVETHEVEPLPDHVLKDLDELEKKWMARVKSD
jgi:trimethylamine--corrinoid protein Co-methyltransferase